MSTRIKNQIALTQVDSSNGSIGSLVNLGKKFYFFFVIRIDLGICFVVEFFCRK